MGIKQDGKQAWRDRSITKKPEIGRNPNFGIMEVFDEAEGSGIIYRQGQSSVWSLLKIFSSLEREQKNSQG